MKHNHNISHHNNGVNTKSEKKMEILEGRKTYIASALIIASAVAVMMGIELPYLDVDQAGVMLSQALLAVFIRRGISTAAE